MAAHEPARRSLLQRGANAAAALAGAAADRFAAWSDPRARALRRRRWALRLGVLCAGTAGFWLAVTALLATWTVPFWVLLITGVCAGVSAFPATLLLVYYRWLRAEPLPPSRRGGRRLPPRGSAARAPMAVLAAGERGLGSLLGVIERARLLPDEELHELAATADRSAATIAGTAAEVVAMERAMRAAPRSRRHLEPTVVALTAQLQQGVRQYHDLVDAAARLVSTAPSPPELRRRRAELAGATDRMQAWAQAFDELARLRR